MVMYYWAREFLSVLLTGQGYSTLPRTIVISIVDFKLFMCEEYHSFFQLLEITRHTLLSDKMGFYFYELPKLPVDVSEDNMLLLWLSLFKAERKKMKILIFYSSLCQQVVHKATIIIDKNDLFGE